MVTIKWTGWKVTEDFRNFPQDFLLIDITFHLQVRDDNQEIARMENRLENSFPKMARLKSFSYLCWTSIFDLRCLIVRFIVDKISKFTKLMMIMINCFCGMVDLPYFQKGPPSGSLTIMTSQHTEAWLRNTPRRESVHIAIFAPRC